MTLVRRLAAILVADVVGYARLIGADEEGTLARLRVLFRAVVQPSVVAHHGRVFKLMGDAFLAEFPSAVEAVRCALTLQDQVGATELDQPEERRIRLRMGVHVGDVVVEGGDLLGDGINLAARLQTLAAPGGVVVSGAVQEAVRGRVETGFAALGEQALKNIGHLVPAFRLAPAAEVPQLPAAPVVTAQSERPSVAVLPLQNMSGDPEQEYFADGITEDIITELSRWRWLLVISRNSTFTYKGRAVDVKQVARDLCVRYVLEGSVRNAGGRVRLTAQLIDSHGDKHIWAERYDRDLSDVFAVQDEVTASIVAAIDPSIRINETQEVLHKQETSLGAWDHFLRGMAYANRFNAEDNRRARVEFQAALTLDPSYAAAMAMLGRTHSHDLWYGWTSDRAISLAAAQEHGQRAVALDSREPMAHLVLANHAILEGRHEDALRYVRRAVELNPNYHQAQFICGMIAALAGNPEAALHHIAIAMRLSPHDPMAFAMHHSVGLAYYLLGQDEQAVANLRTAISLNTKHLRSSVLFAASLARLHRMDEARSALSALKDPEAVLASLPLRETDKARVRTDLARITEPPNARAG